MKIVSAVVVRGYGVGGKIGVPTINFDPTFARDLKEGIYLCRVDFASTQFWGLLHFGPRPTFGDSKPSLEVYLVDFNPELEIPDKLDLEVLDYIRAVRAFDSARSMVLEIEKDKNAANKLIKKYKSA